MLLRKDSIEAKSTWGKTWETKQEFEDRGRDLTRHDHNENRHDQLTRREPFKHKSRTHIRKETRSRTRGRQDEIFKIKQETQP